MKKGIYQHIVNLILSRKINSLPTSAILTGDLDPSDSHDFFAQYLCKVLSQGLSQIGSSQRDVDKISKQISLCNEIISSLEDAGIEGYEDFRISHEAKQLLEILDKASNISISPRPDTPLALGALLTGTRQDPSLLSQLQKEILCSDKIDILCSFIRWSGIRILATALREFTSKSNSQLRIITTSYMGATEHKAIDFLSGLDNTEIKVSYDTHRTRLHAKAYLFERCTGFSSAYIGSSNISGAALSDGLEWNVKISQYEQPFQWEKISATFETYWNDNEFESYSHKIDYQKLSRALSEEKNDCKKDFILPNFDLRPFSFQQEILDKIMAERELQNRNKHLVVAATGTGKTMISAFDFKAWKGIQQENGSKRKPRFLFVAHREEILRQSLYTFRAVLKDQNFGDLMFGGNRPNQLDEIFISIQTYNSQDIAQSLPPEYYDYVIIDEFHHAAAASYKKLLMHIKPKVLLGLTATPERTDGSNITQYFDNHITAEIRLPDAINRKLLCPFQYFGISDCVDYSSLQWTRGGYVNNELDSILTGNDIRVSLIIDKTIETVLDVSKVRGLGFCVSQKHASYMSAKFNEAGIASDFLTSNSDSKHRREIQERLLNRKINFIFVVDLYNEGVDIPEVDTVLFLRPTESLTVFLQQLGRGLRLSENKDCLTVLDFVGNSHQKFRFDTRFASLVTNKNIKLHEEVDNDFPHLPAGCVIQLERKAKEYILKNITNALRQNKPQIVKNISTFSSDTGKELTISNFLEHYNFDVDTIYKRSNWSRLCVDAGLIEEFSDPDEDRFTKGLRRLHHINDYSYICRIADILNMEEVSLSELCNIDKKRLLMLFFTIWGSTEILPKFEDNIKRLRSNKTLLRELFELLNFCKEQIVTPEKFQPNKLGHPLQLHARYTRDEILAALGCWTLESQRSVREGVLYLPDIKTNILFVTLNKSEKHYSPTTMYEDYAISESLFHWQSQSTTSESSETGKRYINHKQMQNTILLFVRENRTNSNSYAEPYNFLGEVEYVSHSGTNPMSIIWRLKNKLPAFLLRESKRLSIG